VAQRRPVCARRGGLAALLAPGLAALAFSVALPAQATLGGSLASVEADRLQLHATSRHTDHVAYTVHEITLPGSGVVREYVSPAGRVFAVTWHGPLMPNLSQLLGEHVAALGSASQTRRGGLGHFAAQTDEVSYVNTGRMRSFRGAAYLIHAIPSGASVHDIQ
jgi:hypothetical protein